MKNQAEHAFARTRSLISEMGISAQIISGGCSGPHPPDAATDLQGSLEDGPDAQAAGESVARHRPERCRRDAAAVLAIRCAAELAWRNLVGEVSGDARRRLRERAFV